MKRENKEIEMNVSEIDQLNQKNEKDKKVIKHPGLPMRTFYRIQTVFIRAGRAVSRATRKVNIWIRIQLLAYQLVNIESFVGRMRSYTISSLGQFLAQYRENNIEFLSREHLEEEITYALNVNISDLIELIIKRFSVDFEHGRYLKYTRRLSNQEIAIPALKKIVQDYARRTSNYMDILAKYYEDRRLEIQNEDMRVLGQLFDDNSLSVGHPKYSTEKWIKALNRNVKECCYQTAEASRRYCVCGRAVKDDLYNLMNSGGEVQYLDQEEIDSE